MLISCPECKQQISNAASACPHCGHPIHNQSSSSVNWVLWGCLGCLGAPIIILIVISILTAIFTNSDYSGNKKANKTNTQSHKPRIITVKDSVFCAYCGKLLRQNKKQITIQSSSTTDAQNKTTYAVCSDEYCQKASYLRAEHPDWSQRDCYSIACKRIRIGMNKEQAIAAWGNPKDINRTVNQWEVHEQWCYGDVLSGSYLYFENGELTSIQN